MRLWKVIVLVDLALVIGFGGGYLWWAREIRTLRQDLARVRDASTRPAGERSWTTDGILRLALPQLGAAIITHGQIPGLMQGMTMGFETEDAGILAGLTSGDRVRFTLQQKGERLLLVDIAREAKP